MYPNVTAERTRAGLTLESIAKVLDIRLSTLSLKLSGKSPLTFKEAVTIKRLIVEAKKSKNIDVNIDMPLEILFEEAM